MRRYTALRAVRSLALVVAFFASSSTGAWGDDERPRVLERADGTIEAGGQVFASWNEWANSQYFRDHGLRCGTPVEIPAGGVAGGSGFDCTFDFTNPSDEYSPTVVRYRIPVVVHVIRDDLSTLGHVNAARVQSQIDILNEDFQAIAGTNGANGVDVQIEFYLRQEDPFGNPSTGITYSNNTTWFNDSGGYYTTLAWDTSRYLNIYTLQPPSGILGYVPSLPQSGIAGSKADRVVVFWRAFGRNAPIGAPYNQGRTGTHEVGHYLGLYHTFQGGCASASSCASNGDRICDTNPEEFPGYGCPTGSSCGSSDPVDNYMDYSDDLCAERFTHDQARRMRCSLENYRSNLFEAVVCGTGLGEECGSKSRYISFQPPPEAYAGAELGIRVRIVSAPDFPAAVGRTYWVGPTNVYPEDSLNGFFNASMLQCDSHVGPWVLGSIIHVTGAAVVPGSSYELHTATAECIASGEESCMIPLSTIDTGGWGDVAAPYGGVGQPNFQDIAATVEKYKSVPTAPIKARAQLQPDTPNPASNIGFSDIGACVNAYKQIPYPYAGPPVCE